MPNFRNFSELTMMIIPRARKESHRLGRYQIGSEQLLIGLLSSNNGASQLLRQAGVNLKLAQAVEEKIIGRGAGFISSEILPFSPKAKYVLESASALAHEHKLPVEPEHLLLAMMNLDGGIAIKVLKDLSVAIEDLKDAVIARLQALSRNPAIISAASSAVIKRLIITTLLRQNGSWVAQVYQVDANTSDIDTDVVADFIDVAYFRSVGYGNSNNEAIANALESLAQMYRSYQAY